ncbi:MAG: AMP-binding protein, partial [Pseudomonadota bacterium]
QPSFSDLVERVGKTRRADRKHHHLPSLDIVQAKRQVQSDFDGRLTNVSMGETVSRFQGMSMEGIESMGVDNDVIDVRDDLSLMYEVAEDRIGLWIEYRNSAFDEAEIDKLVARLQKLVAAIQQDPERPIAEIDILEPGEREQIVAAGDGGPLTVSEANTDVFTAATLAEAFARSAAKHGDAPAVFFRSSDADSQKGREVEQQATQQLSYRELEQRVRAYAALLRNDIGATSKPIAICLPRSPQQLIALLATMASGHSYVPLDPSIPNARALAILQDCGALHLITTPELSSIFNGWTGTQIAAPEVSPLGGQSPGEPKAEQAIQPANAHAYVIYTSGSTGLPKGVRVSHRAVLQRLAFLQSEYALTPSDRMLTNTSYTFDVSVAEIFWPLLAGASLVMAEEEESRDPRALRQLISTHGVSCTCIVPSALTGLLTAGGLASSVELEPSAGLNEEPSAGLGTEPSAGLGKASLSVTDALASLRLVLVAGEALPQTLAHDFHTLCDGRMVNLYGPTEGTIYASATDIDPITSDITIGKAIAATQLYIINSATQLQPFGTEGELAIGGDALAEGYLGREELNLERFQPNPFATGRIYKTGDRARMRPDGVVEYLGRADAQVKLRGFRIELGEIEHLLREHAAVSDAAVLVDDGGSRKQLLAYYEGAPVPGSELRGFLESRVPSYMVPNRIERIQDGIPRLPSGKLNRGALPKTTDGAPISITAPRTEREKSVAECWAKVLDVPTAQIGLESNFFELGGDSLLLISLVCELEAKGLFVEVHELFDNPTVAGSLPFLQQEQEYSSNQSPVIGSYPALARHRKLFADGFAHPAHWNRCILIDFHRLLDQDALQEAANAVSAHHDGLRLSFHEQNGDISFRFHPPGAMETTLSYLDLSALPAEVREKKKYGLLNELNESFDLAKPPLIKIAMIDDERRSTVALIVHHLLIDMRSCQVLLEDLLSSYQAAISHRSVRLPRKTSSLAEWTQALHAHIDQQWKQEELSYWQHELAGVSQCLPEGRALSDSYCAVDADQRTSALAVGKDVTERLVRGVAPRLDVGMQDIVLAAFAAAFRRWAGLNELVLNTCGVGRDKLFDDINLTRTVGELNTVYPLRISLEADNLLTTVAAKLREVPARGLHYGMLRYIAAHPELSNAPEPEVFFNYVSRIDTALGDALGAQVSMAPSQVRSSHPDNRACYRLYAEASIYHGALELDLGYDSKRFTGESIAQLLAHWKQELEALATLRG